MSVCLQRWITEEKEKIYLATAVQNLKTQTLCSNTTNSSLSSCVHQFSSFSALLDAGWRKRKRRRERKRRRKGGGGVLLSFFWPEPLIFLRAQQELGRRSPRLPRVLLVCAYHLHTFLAGWRGLDLIKASSHKFPPRILLVLAALNPYLWWWPLMMACCCPKTTRRGWEDGGWKDGEKERRRIGRKGNSFCAVKTKEKAKGEEEKTAVEREREREDKWVLCVRRSSLFLSLFPTLCMSLSFWLLNQAPFCVKQLPLMTDLWWGRGSELRIGSGITKHARELCKLSLFLSQMCLLSLCPPWPESATSSSKGWTIASLKYKDKLIVNRSHEKTWTSNTLLLQWRVASGTIQEVHCD